MKVPFVQVNMKLYDVLAAMMTQFSQLRNET